MAVSQSLGPVISSWVFILFSVWAQFSGYRLMAKELTFLSSFFSSGQDDRMVTASRLDSPVLASKGKEKKGNLAVRRFALISWLINLLTKIKRHRDWLRARKCLTASTFFFSFSFIGLIIKELMANKVKKKRRKPWTYIFCINQEWNSMIDLTENGAGAHVHVQSLYFFFF